MTTLERKTIESMRGLVYEAMSKLDIHQALQHWKDMPKYRKAGWLALAKWHLGEMRKRKG